jgi:uncharacterized protein with von Willebrand factor type A (vWA) domain
MPGRPLRVIRRINRGIVPKKNATLSDKAMAPPLSQVQATLADLGFPIVGKHYVEVLEICQQLGRTDLEELWVKEWAAIERSKERVVGRQVYEAVHGADPDKAGRAASLLADLAGWRAAKKVDVTSKNLSIIQVLDNADEILKMTDHEPGDAVAIYDEVVEKQRRDAQE